MVLAKNYEHLEIAFQLRDLLGFNSELLTDSVLAASAKSQCFDSKSERDFKIIWEKDFVQISSTNCGLGMIQPA